MSENSALAVAVDILEGVAEDIPDILAQYRARMADQQRIIDNQANQITGLNVELEVTKSRLATAEHITAGLKADLKAMETATLRYYAFASDEEIARLSQLQPNEQAKKIADLTWRLRREMAGKMEIQAALGVMIQRMKTKVPAMSEEDFGKRYG